MQSTNSIKAGSTFKWLASILIILTLIVSIGAYYRAGQDTDDIDYDKVARIVRDEMGQIDVGEIDIPTREEILESIGTIDNTKIDEIYDDTFEEDRIDAEAEVLAQDELDTKDFKRDIVDLLVEKIEEIEEDDIDHKDITKITVTDIDTKEGEEDDREVIIEFKVYFNNYGEEDEEEEVRARVKFYVDQLDVDDDFEDAEVTGWVNLELVRAYGDLTEVTL